MPQLSNLKRKIIFSICISHNYNQMGAIYHISSAYIRCEVQRSPEDLNYDCSDLHPFVSEVNEKKKSTTDKSAW